MEIGDIISLIIAILGIAYILLNIFVKDIAREKGDRLEDDEEIQVPASKAPSEFVPKKRPPPLPKEQRPVGLRSMKGIDKKFDFRSNIEEYRQKTNIDERALQIHLRPPDELVSEDLRIQQSEGTLYKTKKNSRLQNEISSLPSKSVLIISHELIRAPVAFRHSPFPRDI